MTPNQRASLQTFFLLALAADDLGISEKRLLDDSRREGFTQLTEPELLVELRALADRAWIASYDPPLGTRRWRITARGRSALQEQGLA